jgi:GTP-binding protein Era
MHKAGFVNIIGLPNVGKSTLMNKLVGERMSIISPKAQTTRHRILGIVNDEEHQVVFSDTPGYINKPAYGLQKNMNKFVESAFEDADVVLLVTDKYQVEEEQQLLIKFVNNTKANVLILLNKTDQCNEADVSKLATNWHAWVPEAEIIPTSAEKGINVALVMKRIKELLPESPPYYDKDELTDRNMRFFVSEMVREKVFLNYQKEIPYSTQVEVESYSESDKIDRIRCIIFVERESQKNIIIGKGGEAIKKVGIEARKEIEAFIGKQVHLELFVKIKDNWRNNDQHLNSFGYGGGSSSDE